MSNYIGNQPAFGEFKKLDSIVSLFNGSTTQFNLEYNSVGHTIGDATQLIVSLNGVVQEPGTAYTLGIGGGSVVFASAPVSTDTCHIVSLGGVGGTTTPTDGSVTASKLDSNLKDYLEETFTADGTQTVFTLTRAVVGANTLLVTIDGIVQPSSAFTASGTTLTISEVLAVNTNVRVVHMGVKAGVYVPANDSVTPDMLANSINTDIAAGVAALPKAGGTMTGNIVTGTYGTASTGTGFRFSGSDIYAQTNAQDRIRLNTSGDSWFLGNVGIGTTSPTHTLHVNNSIRASSSLVSIDPTGSASAPALIFGGDDDSGLWKPASNTLAISTAGSERMRIDSSGNVGIGTGSSALSAKLVVSGPNTIFHDSGGSTLRFNKTLGTDTAFIANRSYNFHDGNGLAIATQDSNPIRFGTNNTERMRIDSSGTLMVGKTSLGVSNLGFAARYFGSGSDGGTTIELAKDNATAMYINRTSSDGTIIDLRKDNTTVGSIGTNGSTLYIGSTEGADAHIGFGNQIIRPVTSSGASRDNAVDLGYNGMRWRDLYLSGGVYLGGTGSANRLDDYETGTWSPSLESPPGGISIASSVHNKYVKIGNIVHLQCYFALNTSSGSSGSVMINNLPFTPLINQATSGSMIVRYGSSSTFAPYISGPRIEFYRVDNTGNWDIMNYVDVGQFHAHIGITYNT